MLEAILAGQRSPDPNTQVGACIVNKHNRILSSGYNSWPNGICPKSLPWDREGDPYETKYAYVVHAEKNAIYNTVAPVEGSTLFVTMYPCNECAKDIIQARIRRVFYLTNPYKDRWQTRAAERMFSLLDIPVIQHKWQDSDRTLSCLDSIRNTVMHSR
jgi:dCMP deaminase